MNAETEYTNKDEQPHLCSDYDMLESLRHPACVLGMDGMFIYGNEAFHRFFGAYKSGIRLNLDHPFYPEYRKRIAQAYLSAIGGTEKQCFAIINSPEGKELPVEIYLFPMMKDGAVSSILAMLKMVDDRLLSFDRSTLSIISEENFSYENLYYEFSPMPVIRINEFCEIIKCSHSLETYTGFNSEEILEEKIITCKSIFPYDSERIKRAVADIISGLAPFQRIGEVKISTRTDEEKIGNLNIFPAVMNSEITLIDVIIEDITRVKELRDRLNSLNRTQLISDITKGFIHSLNNSINVILSKTQMLLQITEKETVIEGIQVLERSAKDIADQVKRIRNFTGSRNGLDEEQAESLVNTIEDSIEFAKMHFKVEDKENRRNIVIDRKYFTRALVKTDTRLLREIIISIIIKVSTFIQKNGKINVILREANDVCLSVKIDKDGVTDTSSVLPSMVNVFTGIDIRQAADIIKLKIIEEESADYYEIKAIFPSKIFVNDQQGEAAPEKIMLRDLDIIVVEDEIALQRILYELFDRMGNRVFICDNGQEALDEFKRKKYDIVITDYGLQGLTGIELSARIKELNEGTITVLLSGWILNDLRAYKNVIDLFIPKPFQLEDLIKDVSKIMNEKKASQAK
ncbi:MAG: response regulator [Spirochaetes bacterium]|jgi:CheY-like chemotaxis protein/PAS domain-containing protein|nr:response regulator [Spirochaetota bacterium]